MLNVKGLCKVLPSFALTDISFEVEAGQYFVLLGATGCGKSLLLSTIAGLFYPDEGKIFVDGRDVSFEKMQKRGVGLVFQNNVLFPHMNVYDNIAYPLRCKKVSAKKIKSEISRLGDDFNIGHLLDRSCGGLSGGEAQSVTLARAVAVRPKCLLLDEPISSLDVKSRPQIRALLRKINSLGQTIIHVTHDYTEAISLGTHIGVVDSGRLVQTGTANEIFHHPRSEFIARFVGIKNFFKGQLRKKGDGGGTETKSFVAGELEFSVLTDSSDGAGYIIIRSEDVTISNKAISSSARNNFQGVIVDMEPVGGGGIEIIVDIDPAKDEKKSVLGSSELAVLVTGESVEILNLHQGKKVFVGFKASAIKYIEQ